jgi:8-oxo-dGTP diphosphatase
VNEDEKLADAACRELAEETGLKLDELEQLHTAGDPGRDPRGWTVSVVFLARVDRRKPMAKAGDDASEARWFPLDALPPLAFDHATILERARIRLADRTP